MGSGEKKVARCQLNAMALGQTSAAEAANRPGGNATGISIFTAQLEGKRLGLLNEIVPQVAAIGVLLNPNDPNAGDQLRERQKVARAIGLRLHVLRASSDREIEAAFETIVQQRIAALDVAGNPFFDTRHDKLVALAARQQALPQSAPAKSPRASATCSHHAVWRHSGRSRESTSPRSPPCWGSLRSVRVPSPAKHHSPPDQSPAAAYPRNTPSPSTASPSRINAEHGVYSVSAHCDPA
jgi:hypothetical protein